MRLVGSRLFSLKVKNLRCYSWCSVQPDDSLVLCTVPLTNVFKVIRNASPSPVSAETKLCKLFLSMTNFVYVCAVYLVIIFHFFFSSSLILVLFLLPLALLLRSYFASFYFFHVLGIQDVIHEKLPMGSSCLLYTSRCV